MSLLPIYAHSTVQMPEDVPDLAGQERNAFPLEDRGPKLTMSLNRTGPRRNQKATTYRTQTLLPGHETIADIGSRWTTSPWLPHTLTGPDRRDAYWDKMAGTLPQPILHFSIPTILQG